MKRLLSIVFILFVIFSAFASCGKDSGVTLIVDGVTVKSGIYNYYYDEAKKQNESDEKSTEIALQKCKEFAAAQILLKEKNLSVRAYFKRKTAEETENLWSMFSKHYKSAGITKNDINAVTFNKYIKKELLHYYYGSNGKNPVSVSVLKEEFVDLYVGFKAIEGSLLKENSMGETILLTEKETKAIEKKFSSMASQINNKTATIDELNESYNTSLGLIVTDTLPITLAKKDDGLYDKSFFEKVMDIPHGFARVVKSGTSIYVVERAVIATSDEDAFSQYSEEVLEFMKMDSIEKLIKKRADGCKVEY